MNDVKPSLHAVLKRLKLSGLVPTLPDRAAHAQKTGLAPLDFLELALTDEIGRRDHKNLSTRLDRAGFDELHTFEDFDWDAPVTFDRDRVRDLFGLGFLDRHEDILFLGPVGVGKTFLACALGHAACRAGHRVLFLRSDHLLKMIHQSRADNSTEKVVRSLLAPDLLVLDDLDSGASMPSSPATSTRSSSSATGGPPPSSHRTGTSTNGSPSSMTPSSPRAPSTDSPTTPTRSFSRATATAAGSDQEPPPQPHPEDGGISQIKSQKLLIQEVTTLKTGKSRGSGSSS